VVPVISITTLPERYMAQARKRGSEIQLPLEHRRLVVKVGVRRNTEPMTAKNGKAMTIWKPPMIPSRWWMGSFCPH